MFNIYFSIPIFMHIFFSLCLYSIIIVLSMERTWLTFHCWLYIHYITVYVTNTNLESWYSCRAICWQKCRSCFNITYRQIGIGGVSHFCLGGAPTGRPLAMIFFYTPYIPYFLHFQLFIAYMKSSFPKRYKSILIVFMKMTFCYLGPYILLIFNLSC